MTYATRTMVDPRGEIALKVAGAGEWVIRCALALVIWWIGMMKFTGYEANGIQPLVAHRAPQVEHAVPRDDVQVPRLADSAGGAPRPLVQRRTSGGDPG